MIGLLGSAIGNQMLQGEMNVFAANLQCEEMATGKASYWELLEIDFGTRHDSSKTEKEFQITGSMKETSQMLYQMETIVPGSVFDAKFILTADNEMMVSAFWHALQLFKDNGTVGAMSSKGNGLIDVDYTVPAGATDLYTNFLETNKAEIVAFFEGISKEKEKAKKGK
jgi:CRISPR/Cas system CSM-associated protein Csm3 (group 7 of RAMP superfamily)